MNPSATAMSLLWPSMADIVSIPEVAIVFRACLSRKDLAGCVRVSKEWYATFSPLLWRSVRTSFYSPVYFQQHFKNAIPRWGEFIHNLDAYEFFHLHSFIGHTNNLSALRVRTPSLFMGLGWRFMLDIAMANPLITTLHLGAVGNISNPKSDDLLRVIRCLPRLDHLELRFVHKTQAVAELPSKHLLTILTICTLLHTFRAHGSIRLDHSESDLEGLEFRQIKVLDVHLAQHQASFYQSLIQRCPLLEDTTIIPPTDKSALSDLCATIRESCPNLAHVDLSCHAPQLTCFALEAIIRGMTRNSIRTLNLAGCRLWQGVGEAILACQSSSLQVLILGTDSYDALGFIYGWLLSMEKAIIKGLRVEYIGVERGAAWPPNGLI